MPYRVTASGYGHFEMGSSDSGGMHYAAEGSDGHGLGSACCHLCTGGSHRHESCIHIQVFALTLNIQDKSRMREIRSYGSVRGALGNQSPYRDPQNPARRVTMEGPRKEMRLSCETF